MSLLEDYHSIDSTQSYIKVIGEVKRHIQRNRPLECIQQQRFLYHVYEEYLVLQDLTEDFVSVMPKDIINYVKLLPHSNDMRYWENYTADKEYFEHHAMMQ